MCVRVRICVTICEAINACAISDSAVKTKCEKSYEGIKTEQNYFSLQYNV